MFFLYQFFLFLPPTLFFSLFIFFLLLPLQFSLLQPPLLSTLFRTLFYLYFSYSLVNFRIMESNPQHSQDFTFVSLSYQSLFSLSIPFVKNIYTVYFIRSFLLKILSTSLIYIGLSILSLNSCFFMNSELITKYVALLFNNTSTITSSYILSITLLLRIANLLQLEPSQELLDSSSLLNCLYYNYLYNPLSFSVLQISNLYSILQYVQIPYSCSNFSLNPFSQYMGYILE